MWNLDDESVYFPMPVINIARSFTWGSGDLAKRELVREAATQVFPAQVPVANKWAFRILVRRPDKFDVDNIPKIIVDAFCAKQLRSDRPKYLSVSLYEDDTVQHVTMVQVAGESSEGEFLTRIEVFGHRSIGA